MQKIKLFFMRIRYALRRGWRRLCRACGAAWARLTGREEPATGGERRYTAQAQDMDDGATQLFAPVRGNEQTGRAAGEYDPEQLLTERKRPRPFLLSILFTTIKLLLVVLVLFGFAALGGVIGIAKAYIETTPTLDRAQLTKSDRTSYIYDKNGSLITSIADLEYRDWADIEEIPERLQNAFIAIEDVRFYRHDGVDFKRLIKAGIEVLGNSNSSGGSTITQQLIKNKILSADRTYKRKIQEAYLALELEQEIEKKEILEAYLNDINLGESNFGVKSAAKDYFGKDLSALTIRECAMLAGITRNPSRYNPRRNMYYRTEEEDAWSYTQDRTDTVLKSMYESGFITLEEYQQALAEEVRILEVSEQKQLYDMPHFVEYAVRDVVTHLLAQRDMLDTNANRSAIENELRTGGYHIYTTVDPEIQNTVQQTLSEWDSYPALANPDTAVKYETLSDGTPIEVVQPQASAVVIDYHTGELRAVVGSRDTPEIRKSFNRAYQSYMEVGSSIKPLAVYGPALDAGVSPATVIANLPAPIEGWNTEQGYPAIGSKERIGPVTIRRGVVSSLNVVAARTLYEYISPEVGARYLVNLGAYEGRINADGPGLALGTSGLTTIQMAAAYGAIAAGGEYREPLSFTRVVDDEGNVILDAAAVRDTHRVYSEATAWLLTDILTDAVNSGTGTKAKISGMTVAGKTGTNSDYKSVYFAGMTPYYAAAVWIGHDTTSNVLKRGATGGDYAAPVWQAFMKPIHEGLANKSILDVEPAALGLVKKTTCSVSGLLATDACRADTDGHTPVTDWWLESEAPTEYCDMHAAVTLCAVTDEIASPSCPETYTTTGSVVLIRPGSYYGQFTDAQLAQGFGNAVRTSLSVEEYMLYASHSSNTCSLHSYAGGTGAGSLLQLQRQAIALQDELDRARASLAQEEGAALYEAWAALGEALDENDAQALYAAVRQAQYVLEGLEEAEELQP